MLRNKIIYILGFLILLFSEASAQQNNTLYFMRKLNQSTDLNPAIQNNARFYIGLPSTISINLSNNFVNLDDIVVPSNGLVSTKYTTILKDEGARNKWLDDLPKKNSFNQEMMMDILRVGWRFNEMYYNIGIRLRQDAELALPKDLFILGFNGNAVFKRRDADLSYLDINMKSYAEVSFGLSRKINNKLTVGAAFKYLKGISSFKIDDADIKLKNGDQLGLEADLTFNMSGPAEIKLKEEDGLTTFDDFETYDDMADYDWGKGNNGFAVDLGATYKLTNNVKLHASIIDLGFINWTTGVSNLNLKGTYKFGGMLGDSLIDDTDYDQADAELDKLKESYEATQTSNSFKTGLGPKVYLGGQYIFNEKFNVGALSRTRFYNGRMRQQLTLSANTNVLPGLLYTVSYSMMNRTYNNIGMGLAFRLWPLQFYVVSDNISIAWNQATAQNVNLRFGVNWVFGYKYEKRKIDYPLL